jgi:hypothetical protein
MNTLEIKKQLITPSIANQLLEQNLHNRRVSKPVLARYVKDMVNGNWKQDTGELIKISKTGKILDGQHRLMAISKSNSSLYMHIAYNVDDNVFDVLDTGKSRNASDCFMVAGVKSSNSIPSIIAHFNMLESGKKINMALSSKSTNSELLEQYYNDEKFWIIVTQKTTNWYREFAKILPPSYIGGFFAHFYKRNPDKAELFMEQLCTGTGITNQTINLLRNKLMQDKMSLRKMPPSLKIALIIKAWNHYITGTQIKILKFDSVRDEYPTAIK